MNCKRGMILTGVLALELLLLFFVCAGKARSHENDYTEYSADQLSLAWEDEKGDSASKTAFGIDGTQQGINRRIITPPVSLRRGVYAVRVQYETNTASHSSTGCRSKAVCEAQYPWIHSESMLLADHSATAEYFVYVGKDNTEARIENVMDDGCPQTIRIDQITLMYLNGRSALKEALVLLLLFGLLDAACWLFLCRRQEVEAWLWKNRMIVLSLFALLFVVQLPMTMNYVPKGYDLRFHFYRIYAIAEGLRDGVFPVRIHPEWFNGYGYATGIFYGDALLYLPAVLYLLGFSMGTAYKVYLLFINCFTIGNAFFCFRKMSGDRYTGLFGTVLYTASLHRLVALYTRAAVGAYTVMAFWPLLILGFWGICRGEEKERGRSWIYLTLGASGIITSHVLGSLMTVLFTVLFLAVFFREIFRKSSLAQLGKAAAGSLASCLFFIVPFLDTYGSMTLTTYYGNKPLSYNSAFLSQLFSASYNAVADVKADLYGMYQDMPMSVGPVSALILFAVACFLLQERRMEKRDRSLFIRLLFLLFLSLWMSTNLFPYMWLDEYVPVVYGVLKKFEFAWRFLAAASVFITLLFIALVSKAAKRYDRKKVMAAGALVSVLFCWQGADYLFQYNNLMIPFEYEYSFRDLTVRAVYDGAYLPKRTDYLNLKTDLKVSDPELVSARLEARNGTTLTVRICNESGQEQTVDLPLLKYKGYHARSENQELPVSCGENNRLRITVPSGFDGTVKAGFEEPWYWRGAELVSLLFWVWIVWYLVRRRRMS